MLFHLRRWAGYVLGFLLFYEPFMFFQRLAANFWTEQGFTSLHVPCARIPLAKILSGNIFESGPTSIFFLFLLVSSSLCFGPLFCGRLCPAGGFSEYLGRILPDKYKIDWAEYAPVVPLRYGFFLGFLLTPLLGLPFPCAYCNYYALEIFAGFLHTGSLAGAGASLLATFAIVYLLLGLFTKGGRGYCNFLCPVGTLASLAHVAGKFLPGTFAMRVRREACVGCGLCARNCPMRAISLKEGKAEISKHHCIICGQCAQSCPKKALRYGDKKAEEE